MPWTAFPAEAGQRPSRFHLNELGGAINERLQFVRAPQEDPGAIVGQHLSKRALRDHARGNIRHQAFLCPIRWPNGNISGASSSSGLFFSNHSPDLAGDYPFADVAELLTYAIGLSDWSDQCLAGEIGSARMLNETKAAILALDWTGWHLGSTGTTGHRDDAALWSEIVHNGTDWVRRWHVGPATSFTPVGVALKLFVDSGGVFALHSSLTMSGTEQLVDMSSGGQYAWTVRGVWGFT